MPSRFRFFLFACSFLGKIGQNSSLVSPPVELTPPRLENPGSTISVKEKLFSPRCDSSLLRSNVTDVVNTTVFAGLQELDFFRQLRSTVTTSFSRICSLLHGNRLYVRRRGRFIRAHVVGRCR